MLHSVDQFAIIVRQHFRGISGFRAGGALQYLPEFRRGRGRDQKFEEEAVELRFRQRIGAFELDGILCGEHDKRRRENMRLAEYRHLFFFHRFKYRRLSFWCGSIDLVGQNDVSEDRPLLELKFPPAVGLGEHFGSHDIRRHQVRSELNSFERHPERAAQ